MTKQTHSQNEVNEYTIISDTNEPASSQKNLRESDIKWFKTLFDSIIIKNSDKTNGDRSISKEK